MSVRLDQSEALVQRLVTRVDGRVASTVAQAPRSGTNSLMSSFRGGALSLEGTYGGAATPGGVSTPGGTGAPAPDTVGGFCAGAARLRAAGANGRSRSHAPSEGGGSEPPSGLMTPENVS